MMARTRAVWLAVAVTLATASLVQAAVYGVDDVPATTTVITAVVLSVLAFVLTMPSHVAAAPRPRAAEAAQASGVLSPRVVENTPHCKFVRSDNNTRRCEVSTAVSICPPPPPAGQSVRDGHIGQIFWQVEARPRCRGGYGLPN